MASGSRNSISIKIARGYYQFEVKYSKTKEIGIGEWITTPKFSAGGHNWNIRYYPQGHDVNTKGISLSLELNTTSVSKIVTADYEMGLLNKYGRPTAESWIKSTDTFYWDGGFCHGNSMKRSDLELNYISDDFLIIFCSISVIHKPHEMLQNCSIGASPFCLAENLGALLERQEETDVTYKVEGENISAHRLVLASRSPVSKQGCMAIC